MVLCSTQFFPHSISGLHHLRIESLCPRTFEETTFLLDELVTCLAEVGLQLNVRKTKVLTTQSQSPSEVLLRNGEAIEVLDRGSTLMVGMHIMHSEYWQSYLRLGTSSPCCVASFLCKQAILGKQECCNARPIQVFQRHGHSCCLFRCCPQKSIQTRSV